MADKKKDPIEALQDRVVALEKKTKDLERAVTNHERWHKRDIEQMKKLLDIWTERGNKSK